MARILSLFLLIGMAAMGGCADRYQIELQRKSLEAQNIPPANYKTDLLAFLQTYLNNPEDVRGTALSEPQKLLVIDTERYAACLRYNAKNSAGRYLGLRDHLVVFISGKLDRLIELGRVTRERSGGGLLGGAPLQPLREFCATAALQPFPELERLRR